MRPLPLWAAYASVLIFPITQGLIETPLYFSYAMPRLKAQGVPAWLAMSVTGLMLGVQHGAAPFVLEPRFLAWRTLMFIPFGLPTAAILLWRPRLQPYMAFIHILMNIGFATMFLPLAY